MIIRIAGRERSDDSDEGDGEEGEEGKRREKKKGSFDGNERRWIRGENGEYTVEKNVNKDRILTDILEPLFFNTLNEKRINNLVDNRLGADIKIPYLNGGLFDRDTA